MTREKTAKQQKAIEVVTTVGGAVGTALVPGVGPAIGAALLPAAVGSVFGWLQRVRERRVRAWLTEYLRGGDVDPAMNEARLFVDSDDTDVQAQVFESLRAIDDVLCEAAVLPLARLARAYRSKPPDDFFRGMRRMFCELSERELGGMKALFERLSVSTSEEPLRLAWARENATGVVVQLHEMIVPPSWAVTELSGIDGADRVIKLLRAHDLAEDVPAEPTRTYIYGDSQPLLSWSPAVVLRANAKPVLQLLQP